MFRIFSAVGAFGPPTFCYWGGTGLFVFFSSYWFGILRGTRSNFFYAFLTSIWGIGEATLSLGDSARAYDTQFPLMELVVLARPICFLPRSVKFTCANNNLLVLNGKQVIAMHVHVMSHMYDVARFTSLHVTFK